MFTLPVTLTEYHQLIDVTYGRDTATTTRWVLHDNHDRIGYTVTATHGVDELATLMRRARGDAPPARTRITKAPSHDHHRAHT
jgi:hypothetical protein